MSSVVDLKLQGNLAFSEGKYKKAAKIYRDAIALDPRNAVLYSNRAQCFLKLEDFDRALKDTLSGLQSTKEPKLLVKLQYRKGLALKSLGDLNSAKSCFENVLQLDCNNNAALAELQSLSEVRKKPRVQNSPEISDLNIPIRIDEVEVLSEKFQTLLNVKHTPKVAAAETDKIPNLKPQTTSSVNSGSQEPSINSIPIPKNPNDSIPFVERSAMHFLAGLKSLPESKKSNAYNYVLGIEPSEYMELFATSGVDVEYLEFFLEAIAYNISDQNSISKSLKSLQALSKFRRFQLSLDFCDKATIEKILDNVKDPKILHDYKEILQ